MHHTQFKIYELCCKVFLITITIIAHSDEYVKEIMKKGVANSVVKRNQ